MNDTKNLDQSFRKHRNMMIVLVVFFVIGTLIGIISLRIPISEIITLRGDEIIVREISRIFPQWSKWIEFEYVILFFCLGIPSIVFAVLISIVFVLRLSKETIAQWNFGKLLITPLIIGVVTTLCCSGGLYFFILGMVIIIWMIILAYAMAA